MEVSRTGLGIEAGLETKFNGLGLGLGLGCPCPGLGGPGFVNRVSRTGHGLEAGLEAGLET